MYVHTPIGGETNHEKISNESFKPLELDKIMYVCNFYYIGVYGL